MNRSRSALPVPRLVAALVVAALALSLCAPAEARGVKRRPRRPVVTQAPAATQPVQAPAPVGAVIAVDPETGKLGMPSAAQMLELTAAERNGLLRTSEGLTPVILPDGSVMVDLQGRFMTYAILRLDPLGGRVFGWADEATALRRALTTPAPAPAAEER